MKKLTNFILCGLGLGILSTATAAEPNIILILTDDQGYQDLGCYGSPDIKTPHLDKVASEGIRFTDFYVASAICSPSRAALLTGMSPDRLGIINKVFFPNRDTNGLKGLHPKHLTMAEVLKTKGYQTMAVGKWHLGDEEKYLPTNQGFDSYYGIPYSNDMYPAQSMKYSEDCLWRDGVDKSKLDTIFSGELFKGSPRSMKNKVPLMRDNECVEFPVDQTTITKRFTDEAIKFVQESSSAKKPFFLYLAHSMPHTPLFASPDFKGKSERGLYGDTIEEIDFNVGRLMDELKTQGIDKDTIVIFTSDNGPWLVKGEDGGSALPLFEGKMTTFEGGHRVPTIIKWPAQIPAGVVCEEVVSTMDLLPTFVEITGAQVPENHPFDGKSILNILKQGEGATSPHKYFFYGTTAVRSGNWKYLSREKFVVKDTKRSTKGPTLYNLKNDIGESINVIKENPEIAESLRKILEEHKASVKLYKK